MLIPLIELQTLILNLGEAERRAHRATDEFSIQESEIQRLTDSLTRSESELSAARSELEKQRQRVRDLEASGIGGPPQTAGGGAENERLRERVVGLEAVIAQARSEINGQRRRIRELEARPPLQSPKDLAAADENERLREQLKRLQNHLSTAKSELDGQRRRIRELETLQRASSEIPRAAEAAESQQLRRQVATLEARMAESRSEVDHQRRKIRELEALQPASQESAPVAEEVPDQVAALEVQLSEARGELDRQRGKIRELEAYIFESSALTPAEPSPIPSRPTRHPVAAPPPAVGPYDDEQQPAWPSPPVVPSRHPAPRRENREVGTSQRSDERQTGAVSTPASVPTPDPTATRLRHLYRRLQTHSRDEALSPDDQRRWVADLAAYDKALVLACIEWGVPTTFRPGNRLPFDDRVALTRALSAVGLDVAS
ncbi:MAG: hypothetical protein ACR2LJ_05765 [Acidimicrobiales bacterium]